jgi:hypothetical protein
MNKSSPTSISLPPVVTEIGEIHFEGNIIPHSWFNYIKLPSGKSDVNGILILAEIVYWYRPIIDNDEHTGQRVIKGKKFKYDKFNCTASYFVNKFGLTVNQVRKALKRLECGGYIHREYRSIETLQGIRLNEIMFIEPVSSKIREITHDHTAFMSSPLSSGPPPVAPGSSPVAPGRPY